MFVASIFLVFYLRRTFKGLFMYILTQVVFMSIRIQRVRVCEWGALACGWMHLPEVNLECCSSETDLVYWDRASHWHLGLTALDRLPGQHHPSIFLSAPPQCWKTKPVPQCLTLGLDWGFQAYTGSILPTESHSQPIKTSSHMRTSPFTLKYLP